MKRLPICLCLYTSTKGHHKRGSQDCMLTVRDWDRQLPLTSFGGLLAHIRVSPGEETLGDEMATELRGRGFHVIMTTGAWSRGTSHQAAYMDTFVRMSVEDMIYKQPYYLHLEDDSIVRSKLSLEDLLLESCQLLADDYRAVSVRVRRPNDDRGPDIPRTPSDPRLFWSQDVNFQPFLLRSMDFYRLAIILGQNPKACEEVQCERLVRLILDGFSRSPYRHAVYELDHAQTIHLGVAEPEFSRLVKEHGLK